MRLAVVLLVGHGLAVAFAVGGLLIAVPHPELWSGSEFAARVYTFGMQYGGSLHIVLGTGAMFAFGVATLGWRRTGIFFAASVTLSLGAELVGTGTGWPFGNYEYTSGLGYKVLGRVPYSIPLSWFYMGLASFLLGRALLERLDFASSAWAEVGLGVYLLTVWDLALDPAMAHADLPIRFWTWHETGAYLGMPVQNFAGWSLTGLLFMGVSRALWGGSAPRTGPDPRFLFAVYALNLFFAVALSAGVGLWWPVVLACGLGLAPALLSFRRLPARVRTAAAVS